MGEPTITALKKDEEVEFTIDQNENPLSHNVTPNEINETHSHQTKRLCLQDENGKVFFLQMDSKDAGNESILLTE